MPVSDQIFQEYLKSILDEDLEGAELDAALSGDEFKDFDDKQLEEIYIASITKNPVLIFSIPKGKQTHSLFLAAVQINPILASALPESEKNQPDILLLRIKHDGSELGRIPIEKRSYELCSIAIEDYWFSIASVPDEFLDESVPKNAIFISALNHAKKAFREQGAPLSFIPPSKRDLDSCVFAVQRKWQEIVDVPAEFLKDPRFEYALNQCSEIIKNNWRELEKYPEKVVSVDAYIYAAKQDWRALKFVPQTMLATNSEFDEAINAYHTAIKKNWEIINTMPPHLLNYEICLDAMSQSIQAFTFIPKKFRTYDLCLKKTNDILVGPFMLAELQNYHETSALTKDEYESICMQSIRLSPEYIRYVPYSSRDYSLCSKLATVCPFVLLNYIGDYKKDTSLNFEDYKKIVVSCIEHLPKPVNTDAILDCVPTDTRDYNFWETLLKKDGLALARLNQHDLANLNLTKDQYRRLCANAVIQNGMALANVPIEFRDYHFCYMSISSNALALSIIQQYKENSVITDDEFNKLCNLAVSQDGESIQYTPIEMRDYQLCFSAVKSNWKSLAIIQDYTQTTKLTGNQFKQVCLTAVETDPQAFNYVPKDFRDFNLFCTMVKSNGMNLEIINHHMSSGDITVSDNEYNQLCDLAFFQDTEALKFLPERKYSYQLFMDAVGRQGLQLEFILETKLIKTLSDTNYNNLILEAVRNNPMALKFLNDKDKAFVIDTLTPEKILTLDYAARQYFPSHPDYHDKIQGLLSNIEHVVLASGFERDREIGDTFAIYSNHPKRKNKTLHCSEKSFTETLFSDIKKAQTHAPKQINLVLLDHAAYQSVSMFNMGVKDITDVLKKHEHIHRVTLLGCQTAKSQMLEQEEAMIKALKTRAPRFASGLILMSIEPDPTQYEKYLQKMATDNKKQVANEVYLLINSGTKTKPEYKLTHVSRNPLQPDKFETTTTILNADQLSKIGKIIGNQQGKIPFPSSKKETTATLYYRGGKSSEFLSADEVDKMTAIANNEEDRFNFSRSQPGYKKNKTKYPFLTIAELNYNEKEASKLLPSFLKLVVDGIHADSQIKRDIDVKGYTHVMHADLQNAQMKSVDEYSYTTEYKRAKKPSNFFSKSTDNIERQVANKYYKKVETEKAPQEKDEKEQSDLSQHKALKVRVRGKSF